MQSLLTANALVPLAWCVFVAVLGKTFFNFLDWAFQQDGDRFMRKNLDQMWDRIQTWRLHEVLSRFGQRTQARFFRGNNGGSAALMAYSATVLMPSFSIILMLIVPPILSGQWPVLTKADRRDTVFLVTNVGLVAVTVAPAVAIVVWAVFFWLRALAKPSHQWGGLRLLGATALFIAILVVVEQAYVHVRPVLTEYIVTREAALDPDDDSNEMAGLYAFIMVWLYAWLIAVLALGYCAILCLLALTVGVLPRMPRVVVNLAAWLLFRITTDGEPVFKQVGTLFALVSALGGAAVALIKSIN